MRPVVSVICPGHNSALTVTYCLLFGIGKVLALTLEPAPAIEEGAVGPGGPCCPGPVDDFFSICSVSYLLSDLSDGPEDADAPVGPVDTPVPAGAGTDSSDGGPPGGPPGAPAGAGTPAGGPGAGAAGGPAVPAGGPGAVDAGVDAPGPVGGTLGPPAGAAGCATSGFLFSSDIYVSPILIKIYVSVIYVL